VRKKHTSTRGVLRSGSTRGVKLLMIINVLTQVNFGIYHEGVLELLIVAKNQDEIFKSTQRF
jgi:hypothetical protein